MEPIFVWGVWNEFEVTLEKVSERAENFHSTVTSIHQIELTLSDVYREIQSIGGDISRLVIKEQTENIGWRSHVELYCRF